MRIFYVPFLFQHTWDIKADVRSSMQLVSLPFLISRVTLHGIQKIAQNGTGLPHILVLCHSPEDVVDNLWHQTHLLAELCHSIWVWIYTVTCFYFNEIFTEVSMANQYYSICDLLYLFIEWQKSQSSDKECSDWWRHWIWAQRGVQSIYLLFIVCVTKSKLLFNCKRHILFLLMRMINSSFQKCFKRKPLRHVESL